MGLAQDRGGEDYTFTYGGHQTVVSHRGSDAPSPVLLARCSSSFSGAVRALSTRSSADFQRSCKTARPFGRVCGRSAARHRRGRVFPPLV